MDLISRQAAIKAVDDLPNCYNGYSDTYDKSCIIGVLEELPPAQQWIPCSERPPKKDGEYLVTVEGYLEGEYVMVLNYGTPLLPMNVGEGRAWYLSDIEGDYYYDGVTAWMPLPEPYVERWEE